MVEIDVMIRGNEQEIRVMRSELDILLGEFLLEE